MEEYPNNSHKARNGIADTNPEEKVVEKVISGTVKTAKKITHSDLYRLGLSGGENSRHKREKLMQALQLPKAMSTNQLLTALNSLTSLEKVEMILADGE